MIESGAPNGIVISVAHARACRPPVDEIREQSVNKADLSRS